MPATHSTFSSVWAKQHSLEESYPLLAHMCDAASMAGQLFDHWLRPGLQGYLREELGPQAREIVMWLVGTHDIGKANPFFQGQLLTHARQRPEEREIWASVRNRIVENEELGFKLPPRALRGLHDVAAFRRHEQASASYLLGNLTVDASASQAWRCIPAMGHHGRFDTPDFGGDRTGTKEALWNTALADNGWNTAQKVLDHALREACGVAVFPDEVPTSAMILISGLTVVADRLVSAHEWVKQSQARCQTTELDLTQPKEWILTQAEPALARIREQLGLYSDWPSAEDALEAILQGYEPRPAQREAMTDPDGLFTIMSATGSGKTEAAILRHAQRKERMLFLLPTMATSNALMKRVQRIFSSTQNTAALAHGMATIEDFYSRPVTTFRDSNPLEDVGGLVPAEFVRSGMERMLASITVGTVDQALKAALPMKWTHVILLALANAHVIIDEVHTLDPYQAQLLKPLMQWLGTVRARVTLLSATLSQEQCNSLACAYTGYPLETNIDFPSILSHSSNSYAATPLDSTPYTLTYDITIANPSQIDAHINWVRRMRAEYPIARIGVICNRVDWAQEISRRLDEEGEDVLLLHAAMTAGHRQAAADTLLRTIGPHGNGEGICIVGTQAIEASLDIDLDLLSTDLCPSASLIQRAGRVWRRRDPQRKHRLPGRDHMHLHIVAHQNYEHRENLPYMEALLSRTQRWLNSHNGRIEFPVECQDFVNTTSITLTNINDDQDIEAFAQDSRKHMAASNIQSNLEAVLKENVRLSELTKLTEATTALEDLRTRYVESETVRALVLDDTGTIPGAITSIDLELTKPTQEDLKRILRSSINLRQGSFPSEDPRFLSNPWETSLLQYFRIVDLSDNYDPALGLIYGKANS